MNDRRIGRDDLDNCWCCGGLHDSPKALCPACDDAGCRHFGGECRSDHQPVVSDGGADVGDAEQYRIEAEAVSKDSAYTLRQVIEDNVDLRLIAFDPATAEVDLSGDNP